MSPLQLSVYWRLSLLFFFTPFVFFLDNFTVAIAARTCRHDNDTTASWLGTFPPSADSNQSQHGEVSEVIADWWTDKWKEESVCSWTDWLSYGQTVYMVGLLLGSVVGGAISDRYGKRPVLLVCACVQAFCGLWLFTPLAWLSPTWTYLHLSLALPQIVCLPLYLYACTPLSPPITCLLACLLRWLFNGFFSVSRSIPESPRWLLLRRRKDVLESYHGNSPADKKCLDLVKPCLVLKYES
ncbi:hypothetical protein XENOCAPTIV_028472 [Xenoophorus captivus]|uniref:Uncharacterized protein n=1 Tax=Xenoophorus captivus TaxID=1517983 RepID=A0ABV0RDY5_9TELE